jgi:predicted cobalt transporter CbtA
MTRASHLLMLIAFALIVSTVFALVHTNDFKAQLRFGIKVFVAFMLAAVVIGWLMYPFPS